MLEKIKEYETLQEAAEDICNQMKSGHEKWSGSQEEEKFYETTRKVAKKLGTVMKDLNAKKFRHHPSQLDEKGLGASQFSYYQEDSDPSSLDMFTDDLEDTLPTEYQKRPLHNLTREGVRKRIRDKKTFLEIGALNKSVLLVNWLAYSFTLNITIGIENWPNLAGICSQRKALPQWMKFQTWKVSG